MLCLNKKDRRNICEKAIGIPVAFFCIGWLFQILPELNYPVPALRRGIAEEQALSKLVNDDL
ncbi:hypothetical protein DWU89_19175, partial [Parabacteroides acidifaciens]